MNRPWMICTILLWSTNCLVEGNFTLTVNFINYTNPTGLCAECETRLENVTSADQLTPVCCDESPFRSDNCDNTGEARCDTRFRWTIRPFGASLETRPPTERGAAVPPYYFTDCNLPNATCPFSEMSTTFSKGQTGFLGVTSNPLTATSQTLTLWPGKVQFFIEAVDSGLPNIIDSLVINLDNLQLGADFTEEMTFTGYHNISHMTMSFRVACQNESCGRDCTVTHLNNPRIRSCQPDGNVFCTNSIYDPSANCTECFHNLDISTDCSTCLKPNFDPDTNCTACSPGYDIDSDCSTCLNTNYDPSTNCTSCLLKGHNPLTNCTQCLTSDTSSTVGGIAGGVVAVLVTFILVENVVFAIKFCKKKSKSKDADTRMENVPVEPLIMKQNPVYNVTTGGPPQPSTADTDAIQLQPNVLYGVSKEPDRGDQTTYYENKGLATQANQHNEYEVVQP